MQEHRCPADALHRAWDHSLFPALAVDSGDRIVFTTVDAQDGGVPAPPWAERRPPSSERGVLPTIRRGHPLCGPIAVRGAQPGDVLAVRVLDVAPHEWGWTGTGNNGLLGMGGETSTLLYWDLRGAVAVPWAPEGSVAPPFRVPMRPFCGVMGTAPAEPGEHLTTPPRSVGGNLDARRLTVGSTLFLPVAAPDALFSVGDVHAAQGDGEVCGTGIECGATVALQLDLIRSRSLPGPAYLAPSAPPTGPCYAVTGIGPDLMEAAREAVRAMISYLQTEHGLEYGHAYILCSVAVDLTITEVVNRPNWVVSALLQLDCIS
ncbi:MAG TPA: acetamidase/formamidase family protein [Chloroflexota bacterium]|nr:acetamidase/formamidase family protein [Chloroflexota bacterium]